MKKLVIIISALFLGIIAVTWLYFKKINSTGVSNEKIFNVIPNDASLIFEYNNEAYFYDIFKDFNLFSETLGKDAVTHLTALKQVFVDDATISPNFEQSNIFFSLHPGSSYSADLLIVAPISSDGVNEKVLIETLTKKYRVTKTPEKQNAIYQLQFSNKSLFHFIVHKGMVVGSFEENLVKKSIAQILNNQENDSFNVDFNALRNKNSISNLYINFSKLRGLINNFSNRKNPSDTYSLKSIDASASLNINYQKNAFMFSGITNPNLKVKNYFNLFLTQQPGVSTIAKQLPYDVANYSLYYVSDYKQFKKGLVELLTQRKELDKLNIQIKNISTRHAINLDKEMIPVLGKEFGVFQVASGDEIGIIKTTNTSRLSFILSTISSEVNSDIRHLDDSFILYNYFGDPFKSFKRPYYTTIENHLVVANNTRALSRFMDNYKSQRLLGFTDKNIDFQQYLSNQGNIFYFIHNSNSNAIVRSFLSKPAYKEYRSDNFRWSEVYGLAIQFSADKDKFFTNLYMNHAPESNIQLTEIDSTDLKF